MSKLFKLKEWLTVEEAAKQLTTMLGEEVSVADIYRLALDKNLILSMNFPNKTYGNLGKIVQLKDAKWEKYDPQFMSVLATKLATTMPAEYLRGIFIGEDSILEWEDAVRTIDGVWDLMFVGSESIDVEFVYQQLIGGPEITLVGIDGAFVRRGDVTCRLVESFDDNEYKAGSMASKSEMECFLAAHELPAERVKEIRERFEQERKEYLESKKNSKYENDFYPAGGLPKDGVYVVRTAAIMDFLVKVGEAPDKHDKPLSAKERNSMLILIAVLCKEADIDYGQRGIAVALATGTENLGCPLTDDTIRGILKQVKALIV